MAGPWERYQTPATAAPAAGPWDRYQTPAAAPPGAQFRAPAVVSNEDWYRQRYGRDPAPYDPVNVRDEAGDARMREDYEGWLAWDDAQARQINQSLPNPENAGNPNFRAHDDQAGRLRALGQGLFGLGDEAAGVAAGIGGLFTGEGFQPAYDRTVENERNEIDLFQQQNPGTALTMNLLGGAPLMLSPGGFVARGATLPAQIGRSAGVGAATGLAYGMGTGEGNPGQRLIAGIDDAGVGALVGGGAPVVGRALGALGRAVTGNRSAPSTAPTRSQLQAGATDLYDQARRTGVVVDPNSWAGMTTDVFTRAMDEGLDPTLHPRLTGVLGRLTQSADGVSPQPLQQVELMRRVLSVAGDSTDRDEQRLARIVVDEFDDWMDGLTPADVLAGDPARAAQLLTEARTAWRTLRKADVVEELNQRALNAVGANYTQAGWQTAIRQQFRALANDRRRFNQFSAAEQAAILRVVRGGWSENLFRRLGVFAPRGVVSTGMGIGAAAAHPALAALPIGGEIARRIATGMGTRSFNRLDELVRNGGTAPQRLIPPMSQEGVRVGATAGLTAIPQIDAPPLLSPRLQQMFGVPRLPAGAAR